ncbi:MAG: thioredoxin family protein [Desulfobacterales bacterium]|nr:thioredoxin family protein [Desulfobacterales bacterium]
MDKIFIIQIIAGVLIGGSLGAVMGYYGKCSSGTCPLTANPMRGSLYGAFLGVLFATALGGPQRAAYSASGAAAQITSEEEFQTKVLDANQPVLVDFYGAHCPPCHRLAPIIDKLAEDYAGKAVVVKVDAAMLPRVAQNFGIYGTPTVVYLKNGQEVTRSVGVEREESYRQQLDALLDT